MASSDFGRELTTAVLWLRDYDIDVRCVRLRPHKMEDGRVLVDVQPLIPLPETASFQTQLGVKRQAERRERSERHELRFEFWTALLTLSAQRTPLFAKRSPNDSTYIQAPFGRPGFRYYYFATKDDAGVSMWITSSRGADFTRSLFRKLKSQKGAIETEFGEQLEWREEASAKSSAIIFTTDGGYRAGQDKWPNLHGTLVDALLRLDAALQKRVETLLIGSKLKL